MLLMRGWVAEEAEDPSFTWATNAESWFSPLERVIRSDPTTTSYVPPGVNRYGVFGKDLSRHELARV